MSNLFDDLAKDTPTPGGEFVEKQFLQPLCAGDDSDTLVMADWLEDNGHLDLAADIREFMSKENIRQQFRLLMSNAVCFVRLFKKSSRLDDAKRQAQLQVLRLFPGFMARRVSDSVNFFIRQKMREDGMLAKLMPPMPIDNSESEFFAQAVLASKHMVKVVDS